MHITVILYFEERKCLKPPTIKGASTTTLNLLVGSVTTYKCDGAGVFPSGLKHSNIVCLSRGTSPPTWSRHPGYCAGMSKKSSFEDENLMSLAYERRLLILLILIIMTQNNVVQCPI